MWDFTSVCVCVDCIIQYTRPLVLNTSNSPGLGLHTAWVDTSAGSCWARRTSSCPYRSHTGRSPRSSCRVHTRHTSSPSAWSTHQRTTPLNHHGDDDAARGERSRRFTRELRRRSSLSGVSSSSWVSMSSSEESRSRLFFTRYLISKEASLPDRRTRSDHQSSGQWEEPGSIPRRNTRSPRVCVGVHTAEHDMIHECVSCVCVWWTGVSCHLKCKYNVKRLINK